MCGHLDITKSCDDCPIKDTRFCKKNNRDGKRYTRFEKELIRYNIDNGKLQP